MSRLRAVVFGLLALAILCFIWGQSMLPREASAQESSRLVDLLKPILDPYGRIDDDVFHHYVRKAAHFTEYAVFGFCLAGFLRSLKPCGKKRYLLPSVLLCVLVAGTDECIQMFSPDRGPRLRDVALDACGAMFGILILLLFVFLIQARLY